MESSGVREPYKSSFIPINSYHAHTQFSSMPVPHAVSQNPYCFFSWGNRLSRVSPCPVLPTPWEPQPQSPRCQPGCYAASGNKPVHRLGLNFPVC